MVCQGGIYIYLRCMIAQAQPGMTLPMSISSCFVEHEYITRQAKSTRRVRCSERSGCGCRLKLLEICSESNYGSEPSKASNVSGLMSSVPLAPQVGCICSA